MDQTQTSPCTQSLLRPLWSTSLCLFLTLIRICRKVSKTCGSSGLLFAYSRSSKKTLHVPALNQSHERWLSKSSSRRLTSGAQEAPFVGTCMKFSHTYYLSPLGMLAQSTSSGNLLETRDWQDVDLLPSLGPGCPGNPARLHRATQGPQSPQLRDEDP